MVSTYLWQSKCTYKRFSTVFSFPQNTLSLFYNLLLVFSFFLPHFQKPLSPVFFNILYILPPGLDTPFSNVLRKNKIKNFNLIIFYAVNFCNTSEYIQNVLVIWNSYIHPHYLPLLVSRSVILFRNIVPVKWEIDTTY